MTTRSRTTARRSRSSTKPDSARRSSSSWPPPTPATRPRWAGPPPAAQDAPCPRGPAAPRPPIPAAMLAAATESGDNDLVAEAHLLRATALLELGDPAGREELLTYTAKAGEL